jgi:asparagine synthetase B (glutamine-hydrolysing)
LGLPLEILERNDPAPFANLPPTGIVHEPGLRFYAAHEERELATIERFSRVVLSGSGGDELLMAETLVDEFRRTLDWRLFAEACWTWTHVRRPALGLRGAGRPRADIFSVPSWLERGWCDRLRLAERVQWGNEQLLAAPRARRATSRSRLELSALWQNSLEYHALRPYRVRVDVRRPFLDARLVRFALSLPPFPWCVAKELQRATLRRSVPTEVSMRPKTLLTGDPVSTSLLRDSPWGECATPGRPFPAMIDSQAWLGDRESLRGNPDIDRVQRLVRACCLALDA